jgi:hypothetical protein
VAVQPPPCERPVIKWVHRAVDRIGHVEAIHCWSPYACTHCMYLLEKAGYMVAHFDGLRSMEGGEPTQRERNRSVESPCGRGSHECAYEESGLENRIAGDEPASRCVISPVRDGAETCGSVTPAPEVILNSTETKASAHISYSTRVVWTAATGVRCQRYVNIGNFLCTSQHLL